MIAISPRLEKRPGGRYYLYFTAKEDKHMSCKVSVMDKNARRLGSLEFPLMVLPQGTPGNYEYVVADALNSSSVLQPGDEVYIALDDTTRGVGQPTQYNPFVIVDISAVITSPAPTQTPTLWERLKHFMSGWVGRVNWKVLIIRAMLGILLTTLIGFGVSWFRNKKQTTAENVLDVQVVTRADKASRLPEQEVTKEYNPGWFEGKNPTQTRIVDILVTTNTYPTGTMVDVHKILPAGEDYSYRTPIGWKITAEFSCAQSEIAAVCNTRSLDNPYWKELFSLPEKSENKQYWFKSLIPRDTVIIFRLTAL